MDPGMSGAASYTISDRFSQNWNVRLLHYRHGDTQCPEQSSCAVKLKSGSLSSYPPYDEMTCCKERKEPSAVSRTYLIYISNRKGLRSSKDFGRLDSSYQQGLKHDGNGRKAPPLLAQSGTNRSEKHTRWAEVDALALCLVRIVLIRYLILHISGRTDQLPLGGMHTRY